MIILYYNKIMHFHYAQLEKKWLDKIQDLCMKAHEKNSKIVLVNMRGSDALHVMPL